MTRLMQRLQQQLVGLPGPAGLTGWRLATAGGMLLALCAAPPAVEAQFFPTAPPTEVFSDDFIPAGGLNLIPDW